MESLAGITGSCSGVSLKVRKDATRKILSLSSDLAEGEELFHFHFLHRDRRFIVLVWGEF